MPTEQFRFISGSTQVIYGRASFYQGTQQEDNQIQFQWEFADDDVVVTATLTDPGWGTHTPTSGIGARMISAAGFSALIKSQNVNYQSEFSWIAMGAANP